MALYQKRNCLKMILNISIKKNNKLIMKSWQDNKQKTCYICKYIFNY